MATPQQELTQALLDYLYETHANGPRENSRWVMNAEWMDEVRKIEGLYAAHWTMSLDFLNDRPGIDPDSGVSLGRLETILGIPFQIRDDGAAPHLEANPG